VDWTTLPGPAAFIERTAQDLNQTYSVVCRCPAYLDDSWSRKLKSQLETSYVWNDVACSPQEFYRFCARLCGKESLLGPQDLQRNSLHGHLFYIARPSADDWPRWVSLLTDFVIVQKTIDENIQKNVLLIALDNDGLAVPNEALLRRRDILDFLRDEDPFFHACQCSSRDGARRSIEEEVRIHVCSELAHWDFELCRYLLDFPLERLLDPMDLLKQYAKEKQVKEQDFSQSGNGTDRSSKTKLESAVLLAINGDREELSRRVWRGQVQVLFPLIEDQRYKLIKHLRSNFPLLLENAENDDGVIEIGPLHNRMLQERKCSPRLVNLAHRLKKIRNDVAHLKVCAVHKIPSKSELLT